MDLNLKVRSNPIVLKLDTPEFKSIFNEELIDLINLFKKHNYELRVAGGAVRDILLKIYPTDIDFATNATPEQMKKMFEQEEVRLINMNGEKHGTITPRINNKMNFEVTTLRTDLITDGRHAQVQFTMDWQVDANRRDLTINSMFLDLDGSVYDYFFGYEDLLKRRVLFVGDADTRIKEDFLRILRYFRFYGRIAEISNNHDEATLTAIKSNINGLERISGERIWMEVKKIIQGNFAGDLMMEMLNCGIGRYMGLPEKYDISEFKRLWDVKEKLNPITILCGLLNSPEDALKLHERLKLSAFERDLAIYITTNREQSKDLNTLLAYQQMCLNTIGKYTDMKSYVEELLKYHNKLDLLNKLKDWNIPRFPVNGSSVRENGCPTGPILGVVMRRLRNIWAEKEFTATSDELLKYLPEILLEVNVVDGKVVKKSKYN